MDDRKQNMVLRTLYIPKELDDHLRQVAFESRTSKNDLIREFIAAGLANVPNGQALSAVEAEPVVRQRKIARRR